MVMSVCIDAPGGPENLIIRDGDLPPLAPGEVQISHEACGLNFIDVYHRTGLYPLPLPAALGMEGAGRITALGDGVTAFRVGDRVAYASPPTGAYSEARNMPWGRVVPLPDNLDYETAAAMMLKGMTAEYLIRRTYKVTAGETVLFHAAAGGVGLLACQWLKQIGARVIGTAGSAEKAELARAHGCDHVILSREEDIAARVRELTDGAGVPVVYDSVGAATFDASLDSLAPRGLLVSFGNASGPVPPFEPGILSAKGSLYLTRPTLMHYTQTREDLLAAAESLFAAWGRGLTINVNHRYPLRDVAQAHRDLEGRKTTGSTVLIP